MQKKFVAAVAAVSFVVLTFASGAFAAPGDYISGDPSGGAMSGFASDVSTWALTYVLPAILIILGASVILRLVPKAIKKVTGSL